ncbi:MAG: tetratricopeptide repeat protein [bacterium]|nr:tetratricopeptide repeat protein [bacterium]
MSRRDRFDRRPEDPFVRRVFGCIDFISIHRTAFALVLVAAVAASIAAVAYWNHLRSYDRSALIALESAASEEEYKGVADSYPGSAAEPIALFLRGRLLIDARKFAEAEETFSSFVRSFPEHALTPLAQTLRGMVLEQERRFEEAAVSYRALVDGHPLSFIAPLALLHLGGCYERLGRMEEAQKAYERVVAEHDASAWRAKAQQRLGRLGAARAPRTPAAAETPSP